ncbi:hypothetical protein C4K26_0259 [Pseudomonas chlororaphis]|uniref:hypothetical protein n=1 Tax=Pseudomonas chlororaphis TaxID=587753 RepID=UPI000F55C8AD|nr:hypothetical protein [Pseudomonas chlororaphis]AZD05693.1 hypothetical protein C4K26_0259 [Pseudomonas chlororaphis]
MITKYITERGGKIIFDDTFRIDHSFEILEAIDELKEDLLQASFPHDQIIDIGWYPEFCENGSFKVSLIKNLNWEQPISTNRAKDWNELYTAVLNTLKNLET